MLLEGPASKELLYETAICDLLEAMVPMDEIAALARLQKHQLLEKSSLGLTRGLRTICSVLGKTTQDFI